MSADQLVRLATYYGDGRLLDALAEVWDEGYSLGYQDRGEERSYDLGDNPYRALNPTEGEGDE